jgi:alpha-tubulin suppressor-like RCC1 family protein
MSLFFSATANKKVTGGIGLISISDSSYFISGSSGRLFSWGSNSNGQLGDNTIVSRNIPTNVLGTTKTFCKISAGHGLLTAGFVMAIDKNGRAWGWGYNNLGQLGDNTIVSQRTPVSVLGTVKTFCQISAAYYNFVSAIDKNGRAWGWGGNGYGQLGDNTIVSKRTPVSVLGTVKTFCQISSGGTYVLAIDKNGRAWGWGSNNLGQLGDNTIVSKRTPVSVLGTVKTFCQISAGADTVGAIDKNGRAWGWGKNGYGQVGDNTIVSKLTPVSVLGTVKTFCQISSGNGFTLAIDKNGRAWGWGRNGYGQLGDNTINSKLTPVSVLGTVKTFCQIATSAASYAALAIDKYGKVWSWGYNFFGQLGWGIWPTAIYTPKGISGSIKTFCKITFGGGLNDAILSAIDRYGKVWCWGDNNTGGLGDNTLLGKITPVSIVGTVKTFCQISTGDSHTSAIDKNGRAWGWGINGYGQLGDNTIVSQRTPVSVLGTVKTFCKISVGVSFSMAIDKNGRAWGWGINDVGQLGNNAIVSQRTPVSVLGTVKTFCQIHTGPYHVLAIDKNGRAWAWGNNNQAQIGDNSDNNVITSRRTPVSVAGAIKTFCQIYAGLNDSVAIDKNGRAWGWGANFSGELGDNTFVSKRTPVSVLGTVKTFCKISVGTNFTLAIDKNGRAWGWGYNYYGQLGIDTKITTLTPVSVLGSTKTFCEIRAGANNSYAIDKYGKVWSWGSLSNIGFDTNTKTPVQVCNI